MIDGVANDDVALPGALLAGRYRVVEPIGSGGMARVFLARDEALGRPVAVKVLRPELTDNAASDRAAIETRLLASLNHPGLVTLFDAHLTAEPRFLVMEHVVGTTLAQRIATGVLDEGELTALGGHLADALHVVHDAGIVHRDVKPSNILLARSTVPGVPLRAKLADFGIAHLLDSERVTSPSLLIGTAAYIAPELLHGADPAPPSDIYALGLVMLEAATGERAFSGSDGNRGQLLARLSRDPDMPQGLDHHWRDLLCAMTARRPEDRPTALEVMSRLSGARAQADVAGEATVAFPASTAATRSGFVPAASRAAQSDVATAAWPLTSTRGTASPTNLDAPVTAAAALAARGAGTEPTFFSPSLSATATSAPERVTAARQRHRKRTAMAVGALAAASAGVVVAAHLMLMPPQASPVTDVAVPTVVETPSPSVSGVDGDAGESEEPETPADDVTTGTQTVVAPGTGQAGAPTQTTDTVPADIVPADTPTTETVISDAPPAGSNGSAPGENSGNGNGPGANSGAGPTSNGPGSQKPGKPEKPGG
ncbi:protein kinase [Microbacterium sp. NPDC006705]|uniref:serine/threonine-protein kinase n=1 Tax=Microbacterium sp. NPDC006705 TaxID=3364181 RepID=UPI00384BD6E6